VISEPRIKNYLSENFGDERFRTLEGYVAKGGYEGLRVALSLEPAEIVARVKDSGLRGRGGAGFSAGLKWSFMPATSERTKVLVANGDESEPGSFKDRLIMERAPFLIIEGITIAARATGATKAFLYIRGEYAHPARVMEEAVKQAYAAGWLGQNIGRKKGFDLDLVVHRGAGAYICGEETGLLESLEGKKGQPRKKPPFPAAYGAFGLPTTVNNVETFSHVPFILSRGADWFKQLGTEKSPGTTLFGVSGHVAQPGLYELPLGTPLREVIAHAGGVRGGRALKAVIPGGMSMPVLPPSELDVPMAEEFLSAKGTHLGTGGIMVMDETTCLVRVACVISYFFRDESCGQCTQCREGTGWIYKLCRRIESGRADAGDLKILSEIAAMMEGQTICAFADAASWPVAALMKHFPGDFQAHIDQQGCPFPGSFEL
jgi:NADH-quinone oxidoreductase subunit F